jgi:hypothetical protein
MTSTRFYTSRPRDTILPQAPLDAHQRLRTFGPIQPMEPPSFLERLFKRR